MTKTEISNLKKRFGKHVQKIRLSKELSLRDVSANCSLDDSNISKIENGHVNPTLSTLIELAAGLEIQPEELLKFK